MRLKENNEYPCLRWDNEYSQDYAYRERYPCALRNLLQRRAPEETWNRSAWALSVMNELTIKESEEKEICNPENVRKMFHISDLKSDEHRCSKHNCRHSKAVGIGELSSILEGGDHNNGRYHN